MKEQIATDLTKVGGVFVGGATIWKITPEQFAAIATGVYFTIMAGFTAWKWWREWRKSRKG
jgi:hypothetical protein